MVVKLLHQSSQKLTKSCRLSPAQVNPPAISPVVALNALLDKKVQTTSSLNSLEPWDWPKLCRSQDILGYRLTPDEFLNNPELQLKIIEHKLSEYWQEALVDSNGDEEVAVLRVSYWYSGNPNLTLRQCRNRIREKW